MNLSNADLWQLREKRPKDLSASEKQLLQEDNVLLKTLQSTRLQELRQSDPRIIDPVYNVPICQPLRPDGDPREDIYCLTPNEIDQLHGNKFGITPEKYPSVSTMIPYTDSQLPPNEVKIFYSSTDKQGVPTKDAYKITARFYGQWRNTPFRSDSLHADKGSINERILYPPEQVRSQILQNQQITENNRDKYVKLQADYKKTLGKLKKTPTNPSLLAQRDILLKKMEDAEFLEGIESLDKLRALPDGTDTFRDAIALHGKNHSVVLFIHELLAEKNRLSPEQQRQFAIHNITPFAFPYEAEFVKSYTQNPPKAFPKHFPLVITNIFNNTKRQLEINGLPRQGARWCSNMYKIDASNYFYKQFDLNGITEKVGMTRYQSIRRFSKQPAITLSILSLDIQNTYQDGTKDNPPNLPPPSERDAEGNHIFYRSQYSPAKQQWKIQKVTPSPFKVYQAQPIFDVNLSQELEIMGSYNFKSSPAINGVHLEGCMMCPYAHAEEFHLLKTSLPEGYNQACAWRDVVINYHQKEHSIFGNPNKSKLEQYQQHPEWFVLKNPDQSPSEHNLQFVM